MARLIFMLEEPSMKGLLEGLLPRMVPGWEAGRHFLCVPHEGKSDLEKSLPRKLRAWREPNVRFVVVRDADVAPCTATKGNLTRLCVEAGRPETLVRIVCRELESWYLGDLDALAEAFGVRHAVSPAVRKKYRDPDRIVRPSSAVKALAPSFQKGSGARAMGAVLRPEENTSHSFRVFVSGVRRVADELGMLIEETLDGQEDHDAESQEHVDHVSGQDSGDPDA